MVFQNLLNSTETLLAWDSSQALSNNVSSLNNTYFVTLCRFYVLGAGFLAFVKASPITRIVFN